MVYTFACLALMAMVLLPCVCALDRAWPSLRYDTCVCCQAVPARPCPAVARASHLCNPATMVTPRLDN